MAGAAQLAGEALHFAVVEAAADLVEENAHGGGRIQSVKRSPTAVSKPASAPSPRSVSASASSIILVGPLKTATLWRSGSTIQTRSTPAAKYSPIFLRISLHRSEGDTIQ